MEHLFTFVTVFITFYGENELEWEKSAELLNFYKFPKNIQLIEVWDDYNQFLKYKQVFGEPCRVVTLCNIYPTSENLTKTDDTVFSKLVTREDSLIDRMTSDVNQIPISNTVTLELEANRQWFCQKHLHNIWIERQMLKLFGSENQE